MSCAICTKIKENCKDWNYLLVKHFTDIDGEKVHLVYVLDSKKPDSDATNYIPVPNKKLPLWGIYEYNKILHSTIIDGEYVIYVNLKNRRANKTIIKGIRQVQLQQHKKLTNPSISQMISNFTSAMANWAKGGFKVVPQEEFTRRLEICRKCDAWNEQARGGLGKCNHVKCGCTKLKHWLETSKCPDGKW